MKKRDVYLDVLLGMAVGDALGVPVEFKTRNTVAKKPVTGMIGYGTYNLPPGTWSDDSSMTFCLAEALTKDFKLKNVATYFVKWARYNYWTPRGTVFDIGIATRAAISRLAGGIEPEFAGGSGEFDNGNGSLMRILPLLFYIKDKPVNERFELVKQVSSITHRHMRSIIACFYYLEFARLINEGMGKWEAYTKLQSEVNQFLNSKSINAKEIEMFDRLLKGNIYELDVDSIYSSGYVVHTLEASIWCLLKTDNYSDAVLKAVNLGDDTDTTGAVTGGLAGLLYGNESIPTDWVKEIARLDNIKTLAERLGKKFNAG